MTVISLITGDDDTAYGEEVRALTSWCQDNNLHLNVSKTKELIVDFRRRQREEHAPLSINRTTVEKVNSFRFLWVHISEDLTWTHHTDFITKSARQRLFFLPGCRGSTWTQGSSAASTGWSCHPWRNLYTQRCRKKANKIIKDPSHPATDFSVCCRLADGSAAFEPEPPGSGRFHPAGHKTFELCSQHRHILITPSLL
ncbi:hypothetical protein L3Q82_021496, partial [Scortum barcoo]